MRPAPRLAMLTLAAMAATAPACHSDGLPSPSYLDASSPPTDLADDRSPWDRDLSLRLTGLDADEGRIARLRIYNTAVSVRTPWRSTVVTGGVVSMYWRGGFSSDTFGEFVDLYLDRDADARCTDSIDSAYRLFINNTFPPDGVLRASINATTPQANGGPQPLPCAQLD